MAKAETEDIRQMTLPEMRRVFEDFGARPFAATQAFQWLHRKGAASFSQMTNLSADLRARLSKEFFITKAKISRCQTSKDGTVKLLVEFEDGLCVETVLLTEMRRKTQCVSTQVGCPLGCTFCSTASLGFRRNLTAGEIVAQVEDVQASVAKAGNLVFMGMGEPFLNYDNLIHAIRILNAREGLSIGARRITVSTSGIPEGIRRLAGEKLQVRLALSLNATTDGQRSRLMPVNKKYPLPEILKALDFYISDTGRRVTFEYVLIPGENDSDDDLRRLTKMAGGMKVNINLIELNPGSRYDAGSSAKNTARKWKRILVENGVEAVIRFRRGVDISAGCGQLALKGNK